MRNKTDSKSKFNAKPQPKKNINKARSVVGSKIGHQKGWIEVE